MNHTSVFACIRRVAHGLTSTALLLWVTLLIMLTWAGQTIAAEPLESVTLQLRWYHQFQFAGYYAAIEQGFYRDAGLEVQLKEYQNGLNVIDEVLSGHAQYGVNNSEILLYRLQGKPIVVLAPILQHSPLVIMARQDSGIITPHDLIGRRIKMPFRTRSIELLAMLKSEGITAEQIQIIDGNTTVADCFDESIDALSAYLTNQPYYWEQAGIAVSLIKPITYGIDFYGDCLFTSEEEVRQHPKRVKVFREASLRGWQYAMAHPDELIEIILTKYTSQKTREHLRYEAAKMRELMLPDLVEVGLMNLGRWQHIADTFVSLGMAEPEYDLAGFLYNPYPLPDYRRIWLIAGIALSLSLVIGGAAIGLWMVNTRLQGEIVERRQLEASLRESEARYRELFENINSGVAVYEVKGDGQDFIFTDYNKAAERLDNDKREDVIGKSVSKAFPGVEQFGLIDVFRQVWRTGAPAHHPITMYADNRLQGWYENFVYKLPSGEIVAVFDNVTERKQIEESLRIERNLMARIMETSPVGITTVNIQGHITFANPRAEQILGLAKNSITQRDYNAPDWKITDYDGNPFPDEQLPFQIVKSTGKPVFDVRHAIAWPDGRRVLLSINAAPLLDNLGNFDGMAATLEDVTQKVMAERSLQASERRFHALFDTMIEGVALHEILYDAQGEPTDYVILDVNLAYQGHTGLSREHAVGKKASELYGAGVPPFFDVYVKVATTGEPARFEVYFEPMQKHFSISICSPGKGQFATIFEDISERKRAEQQIQQLNTELEQRVRERTAELEAVNRDLRNFIYISSHDLKTPLHGIAQLAACLVEDYAGSFDEQGHEMVRLLINRVKRMDNLLNGILEYSGITHRLQKEERLDLHALVQDVIKTLAPPDQIQMIVTSELPVVIAEKSHLQSIFQHLLNNAITFMETPEGRVTIGCRDDRDHWTFSVTDTGPGIDPKYHGKIFQMFQTLVPKDVRETTGVGLAIVKKIVEMYGGRIWVESMVGKGSSFYFTFPKIRRLL